MGGIQGGLNPTYCFEAGTPVKTAAGAVAIENVAVGDQVLSYDYVTGQQTYKPVTATSVRQTNELVTLTVNGGEQITTTPRHPFYVVNDDTYHGYTAAEYLSEGDCVLTADGGYATITAIARETLEEPIDVYNLTVENNHSYYVGENELLAHNMTCHELRNVKFTIKNHGIQYMKDRGWDMNKLQEALSGGKRGYSINRMKGGNMCSVYLAKNGSYVVIDDVTNEIVQFSRYGDTLWRLDRNIVLF